MMTASEILAIPLNEPERLFQEHALAAQFRSLVREWHPDHNSDPRANEVLQRIYALRESAKNKLQGGTWAKPNVCVLLANGKKFEVSYKARQRFELGEVLVGSELVTYMVRSEHATLYNNAQKRASSIVYPDAKFRKGLSPYFPQVHKAFEATLEPNGKPYGIWVLKKPKDTFSLRRVLDHYGGKLDPRHVAWIISSLQNLACGLDVSKLSHNAISLDNVYISPGGHAAYLLGGWWYTTQFGQRFKALPKQTVQVLPRKVIADACSDGVVDQILIRSVAKELLGDARGLRTVAPKAMMDWLNTSPRASGYRNYKEWTGVREAAFGPRKFIPMNVTAKELFPT